MKTKFLNPAIYALLICLTTSFILSPANKESLPKKISEKKTPSCAIVEFVPTMMGGENVGIWNIKAVSTTGTTIYFDPPVNGSGWTHLGVSGMWLIYIQVHGSFGSLELQTAACMNYPNSAGTAWYMVYDGFIEISSCMTRTISFWPNVYCN